MRVLSLFILSFASLLWIVPSPALAQLPSETYTSVLLQARVLDRLGHPVPNLPLRLTADLNGVALQDDGRSEGVLFTESRTVKTDVAGFATWHVTGLPWTHETNWFRGRMTLTATLPHESRRELTPLGEETASKALDFPASDPLSTPLTLYVYEEPGPDRRRLSPVGGP